MANPIETIKRERIKKLEELKKLDINPYPSKCNRTHTIKDVLNNFSNFIKKKELLTIAGRIVSCRQHGKMAFLDIQDQDGKIQVFISKKNLTENKFKEFKLYDIGDFIEVTGKTFKTTAGEKTINANTFKLLTKSIHPIPDSHFGIKDEEKRYRLRYLDLFLNKDLREMFIKKAKFWDVIRNFMKSKGFFEVETPTLEVTTGGAEANPFVTHHQAFDLDVYMRISIGELWQKRLMAAGYEKTFEIGRAYRNEGSSPEHLQEFTNMEFYWAYANFKDGMRLVVELYKTIAKEVFGKTKFTTRGHTFDLADEWDEIDYREEVLKQTGIDILKASEKEMREKLDELNVKYEGNNKERFMDTLWKYCRKNISGPAFLVNVPKLVSPLSKEQKDYPGLTERFQPILAGAELGNGFSELNDPVDQRNRFKIQEKLIERGDDEAMMPDWEFCEMLEYGMPPTCGYGMGERLFAFLVDKPLRETTLFPLMKPTENELKNLEKIKKTFGVCNTPVLEKQKEEKEENILVPKRDEALVLLKKYVKKDFNIKHALFNEACMRSYAKKYGHNQNLWGITGLLHDISYEKEPDEHGNEPLSAFYLKELKRIGTPDEAIYAIQTHGHNIKKYPRNRLIDKTLYSIDEMTGLIYAVALVRPNNFDGMKVKSVMKKFKDKSFASNIDRESIKNSLKDLKIDLKNHIETMIEAMANVDKNGYK